MKKLLLATHNQGKVLEFKALMKDHNVEVLSLFDINYELEIEETGVTFEENALIKARTIAKQYSMMTIADDSGLVIDALDGRPGVYSAIYAGEPRDDEANIDKVLAEMKDVPESERSARFICVLAMVDEAGNEHVVCGQCEGVILTERRGTNGFGYDPIFYNPSVRKTMAEMSKAEKNAVSHRRKAIDALKEKMKKL